MNTRNIHLDLMRTFAIILMVIFHFIYDLKHFGWLYWDIPDGSGWREFRYVILTLFFLCIGAGLTYSHARQFKAKAFLFRLGKIMLGALAITLMSLVMFPKNWIFFGVLHFIALSCVLAIPFIRLPIISTLLGVLIIVSGALGIVEPRWPFTYINHLLPHYTTDYVPLFPWFGVILLGIALGHSQWFNKPRLEKLILINTEQLGRKKARLIVLLTLPGKHSLIIYLVHQPLLFALLAPIHWLIN